GGSGLAKRLGTLLSGLLECGAFCGIIFGWASLVFVLKDLGYFEGLCQPSATPSPNLTLGSDCSGQDEQFSLVFTIGSFMNNFMTFPMGIVFDRFGTTAARLIAISLYTSGTLLVAFSTPGETLWPGGPQPRGEPLRKPLFPLIPASPETAVLLFPAMSMLSVGGILLILTNMQVGNLFGNYRSIIITLYNGAFDSSSAIFLIVKLLYERGLSLRAMFLFLAACSAWHLLRTLFLMPRTRIPYPLPPDYHYGYGGLPAPRGAPGRGECGSHPAGPEETPLEPAIARGAGSGNLLRGDGPGTPFRACASSWLFAWHVAWLSVMQLRHYLFIGTLNPQLEHLARGDHALGKAWQRAGHGGDLRGQPRPPDAVPPPVSTYTNAFAFTQLCGVLCAPWNGLILDRHKRGKGPHPEGNWVLAALADLRSAVLSLVVTVAQCLLFSVFAAVPVLPVQFGTFALQVISRSFLYGGNAAFLAIAFPPQHFGKLYGLAMALSAVVALLQYPCVALVQGPLQGDPFYVSV
ncbi:S43A3 protein, partial [Oenanthe oenanthe]|nr:S43A3 protein [Oenanthe oenanthe]